MVILTDVNLNFSENPAKVAAGSGYSSLDINSSLRKKIESPLISPKSIAI